MKKRKYKYVVEATVTDYDQAEVIASNITEAKKLGKKRIEKNNPGTEISDVSVYKV